MIKMVAEASGTKSPGYGRFFEAATDGMLAASARGIILDANPSACRILARTREELVGTSIRDLFDGSDPRLDPAFMQLEKSGRFEGRLRLNHRAGLELEVSLFGDQSGVGIVIRKTAGYEPTEKDISLAAFEQAADGMLLIDREDGRLLRSNAALQKLLGYTAEDISRMTIYDIAPYSRETVERNMRVIAEHKISPVAVRRQRRKDGSLVDVEMRGSLISCNEREVLCLVVRDTSGRKEAELRYRTLVEQIPAVTYIDLEDGSNTPIYRSPQIEKMLGYAPEEWLDPSRDLWSESLHPEDRDRIVEAKKHSRTSGGPFSEEYRRISRDDRIVWVRDEAALIQNREQKPRFWQGVMVDVTDRKEAEQRYRSIFENAAEGIFQTGPDGRLLTANPAFARLFGYDSPQEMFENITNVGRQIYLDPSRREEFVRIMREQGRVSGFEFQGRRKDGNPMWFSVSARQIRDVKGRLLGYEGTTQDITERKQAEESFRHSMSVLLALYEAGQIMVSSLALEEIGPRLLEIIQRVSGTVAASIYLIRDDGVHRWHAVGPDEARDFLSNTLEAREARRSVLASGEFRSYRFPTEPAQEKSPSAGLCLPLRARDQVVGALEVFGPESLTERTTIGFLSSLANHAGSALENARLYEELARREDRLQQLVGKLIATQEEERRRVAYEVHDGLTQIAIAAHQHLQAIASDQDSAELKRARDLVQQTVVEARRVIADLRPTALDDLGLVAAVRMQVEKLREEGWRVFFEENLGDLRLPGDMETALYRVIQEALNNARKHARTDRARVVLTRRRRGIHLEVQDYGRGFDPEAGTEARDPGERMGLSSIRERIAMFGGKLKILSNHGDGTSIVADIPLPKNWRDR